MPRSELVTPGRERQLADLKQRLGEWYWNAVEKQPSYDDGESHDIKFQFGQVGRTRG